MKKHLFTLFLIVNFFAANAQAPTSGLVAYWPLNGNFTDAGPNNISTVNTGSIATTNNIGTANTAMAFLNTLSPANPTVYATPAITSAINFATGTNFTVSFSFKLNSIPASGGTGLFDNCLNYGGYGVWVWHNPIQLNFNCKNGSLQTNTGTTVINLNTWYHITCVRNGIVLQTYINGTLVATGNEGSTTAGYAFTPKFGTMFFNSYVPPVYNGLNGSMDEFRIYNRALSAVEITALASFALPIKLSSFNVVLKQNKALITWQTSQEQNSKDFIIQRSMDGVNFTNIKTILAAGNASIPTNYSYQDDISALANKKFYYRLQQNDKDGKFTYSDILIIKTDNAKQELIIFSNPIKEEIKWQASFFKKGNALVTLINANGKSAVQKIIAVEDGIQTNTILIPSSLAKGIYVLNINTENEHYTTTILKQ